MKPFLLLAIIIFPVTVSVSFVEAQNPFTSPPKSWQNAPKPPIKNEFFVKIIFWQHQLKQKMSTLIRSLEHEGGTKPLLWLMALAFGYGAVHAAGPGHGKVIAVSYVMSHKTTILGGILLAVGVALLHGLTGAVGVLVLHRIINFGVNDTLAGVTDATQLISFFLIALLGMFILAKNGYEVAVSKQPTIPSSSTERKILPWAVAIGLVPCPAVVMVMLFCLSMKVLFLGGVLAACISLGMATTLAAVLTATILGKAGVLTIVSTARAAAIEQWLGLFSGALIAIFGIIFFISSLASVYY